MVSFSQHQAKNERTPTLRLDQAGLQDNTELLKSSRDDVTAGQLSRGTLPTQIQSVSDAKTKND